MSRSALLFVIAFSLCVGFFGCSKDSGGGGLSGGGPIVAALVGEYVGTSYFQLNDNGTTMDEFDHTSYSHQLFLYANGSYLLIYIVNGILTDQLGTWSEHDIDTLNFSPVGIGCTSFEVDYTVILDPVTLLITDLTLDYDHPCGEDYFLTEYYTRIN